VVVNDRWGKGDRHKHGGYYTTEYGAGLPNADNPWEENRGMAHSFGYSRTERFKDYNSTGSLLYMLIDIVSRGGNFLLDIGPTADGRIPPLMEERLAEMGDWLEVNGEAVYGTTTHTPSCQWTGGRVQELKHGNYRVKYDVNKLLKNPDEGMARKEALFTRKGEALYAICPVFPDETLTLDNMTAKPGAKVTFLGLDSPALQWIQEGANLVITMPKVNPSRMPCRHAWTFKISAVE
jgi:alpha-L-fucosidase